MDLQVGLHTTPGKHLGLGPLSVLVHQWGPNPGLRNSMAIPHDALWKRGAPKPDPD